ncbi:MAG: hypothetical protein HC888_10435 [Candidatus Competibacteraceae bacterium]|nr:hypothetical protein [Candidatus Competibacteraceae bacterium]
MSAFAESQRQTLENEDKCNSTTSWQTSCHGKPGATASVLPAISRPPGRRPDAFSFLR